MSDHTYDVYYINIPTENIIVSSLNLTDPEDFWNIYNKFQSTILKYYPDTPCVYRERLLWWRWWWC